MSEKGDMGLIDSCEKCRAVKWAGYSNLCPRCKAQQEWEKPPDGYVTLARTPPKEKK